MDAVGNVGAVSVCLLEKKNYLFYRAAVNCEGKKLRKSRLVQKMKKKFACRILANFFIYL